PSITNIDPICAVSRETTVIWIMAAIDHPCPSAVQGVFATPFSRRPWTQCRSFGISTPSQFHIMVFAQLTCINRVVASFYGADRFHSNADAALRRYDGEYLAYVLKVTLSLLCPRYCAISAIGTPLSAMCTAAV